MFFFERMILKKESVLSNVRSSKESIEFIKKLGFENLNDKNVFEFLGLFDTLLSLDGNLGNLENRTDGE